MIAGVGAIALLAIFAALLAAYGSAETARSIDEANAAQSRMEQLAALSRRVGDYAILAVETAAGGMPAEVRASHLEVRAAEVESAFARLDHALGSAVNAAESESEETQMRHATRGLTLARMRAQYDALRGAVEGQYAGRTPLELRPVLDGFATRFSPLLNEAMEEEQRERDRATASVQALRGWMLDLAIAAAILSLVLLIGFYLGLVHPLLARLRTLGEATTKIGQGNVAVQVPLAQHDELGVLFAKINLLAARLARQRRAVDADRAQLNQVIEARTRDLSAANQRLSEADGERRRFFADIGHELRTPLTVISAEAELLLSTEAIEDADMRSGLVVVQSRARRLNRRIDDLLRVARSESGQIELDSKPFALATCLRDAIEDMRPALKHGGVRLLEEVYESISVKGDRDWCRQVVGGLIDNAVRHSCAEGRILVQAAVERGADAQCACIRVLDEGSGLDAGEQEEVFSRFVRGSRSESSLGFGVGLALAKWVIEQQGGRISLASPAESPLPRGETARKGPGLEVSLWLPLACRPGAERLVTAEEGEL